MTPGSCAQAPVGAEQVGAQQAQATSSGPRAPAGTTCVPAQAGYLVNRQEVDERVLTVQKSHQEETKGQ